MLSTERSAGTSVADPSTATASRTPTRYAEVAKRWTFDAAHHLPDHAGKCRQPHGHTYLVEVAVVGPIRGADGRSDGGMVIDFGDLSAVWKEHIEPVLDHQDLNQTIGRRGCWPTTAENIAHWIREEFRTHGVDVAEVSIWETPTSRVTVGRTNGAG